ncbi:MAG: LysR family transcriptional regulator [Gammaproteobacteria bacterium]|nr:LysR family transcriptional regulator [Gammaproteobacteria bacterium]MDE2346344.1 LysR family transcriptional regulator [Gammaproteobacteria bacterium]
MNLWHLAIFHAVAETGSISAGAARLRISQPAVTRQLQQLEAALGSTLVDRLPRGVRLTESGMLLYDYAQRIFALENEAEDAVREMRQLYTGELAIGASSTIGNYLLPPLLAEYRRRYPGVEISVEISNTHNIEANLLNRRLALGLTEGALKSPELHAEVFLQDQIVPIASARHPLARQRRINDQALSRETLLLREPGSGTREFVDLMLQRRRLKFANSICLGSTEAIKKMAAAGSGVAFISRFAIEAELNSGTLKLLAIPELNRSRPLYWGRLHRRHLPMAAMAFLALLSKPALIPAAARP